MDLDLPAYAIGGLSVGEDRSQQWSMLEVLEPLLPKEKPRYLMGVSGTPEELWEGVERGVDMFDCVFPTRIARNGTLFTPYGRLAPALATAATGTTTRPVDLRLAAVTPARISAGAYLRHLLQANENDGTEAEFFTQLGKRHANVGGPDRRKSLEEGRFSEEKTQVLRTMECRRSL